MSKPIKRPINISLAAGRAIERARESWKHDGYAIAAKPLVPAEMLDKVRPHVEAVFRGEYDTGVPPYNNTADPFNPNKPFVEVAMAHLADRAINEFVRYPAFGEWVAAVTGARWLQIWNVQLMKKQPSTENEAVVGWHQDDKYLKKILKGENINLWIALEDVTPEHGPVRFVRGSNHWGDYDTSFFHHDAEGQREQIGIPEDEVWEEVVPWLPAGCGSIHERRTLHGSGLNRASTQRLNMIIHLRSEKSEPVPGSYYMNNLDDERSCPVIFDAR